MYSMGLGSGFFLKFLMCVYFPVALVFTLHGASGYSNFALLKILGFFMLFLGWVYFFLKHKWKLSVSVLVYFSVIVAISLPAILKEVFLFDGSSGLQFLFINALCLILFYSISRCFSEGSVYFLLWGSLIISLIAIYLFFSPVTIGGLSFGAVGANRMIGPFSTPNRFAEVPAVGALTAFFIYSYKSKKYFFWIFIAFILLAILAGSKGVLLPLLLCLLFGSVVFTSKKSFKNIFYIFLAFSFVAFLAIFNEMDIMQATRLDIILDGERDLTSGRTDIWALLISAYAESDFFSALFGHGVSGYYNLHGVSPHSTFFLILFDYGLILLCFYFLTTFFIFWRLNVCGEPLDRFFSILLLFAFVRGVSMPTYMVTISFSMLAYWAAVGWFFSRKVAV